MPLIRDPTQQTGMLACTERQVDPIKVPLSLRLPNLVRISFLMAILPDPRAYFDVFLLV